MDASGGGSNVPSEDLRDLRDAVRELQRRVSMLEQHGNLAPLPLPAPAPALAPVPAVKISFDAAPAFGVALLGIAGAYLLRAIAELGTFPLAAGVMAGIVYAAMWLWLAARASAERKFASAAYVFTSVLIFAPLIWEATIRLGTISSWIAAAVTVAFSIAAEAISWRKNLKMIAAIPPAGCAALALALLIGTHDLVPFTLALLMIGAVVEFAAIEDHTSPARWMVALAADLAVLVVITVIRRPEGLPEGYAPMTVRSALTLAALLSGVYVASAVARTLVRRKVFAISEIGQTVCAFLIGLGGIYYISGAALPVGIVAVTGGIACYAIASGLRAGRNKNTYATFGLLLVAAGTWMLTSGTALVTIWSVLAIIATLSDWHGTAYLWLAAIVSGAISGAAAQLIGNGGTFPVMLSLIPMIAAIVSYALAIRERERRVSPLLIAGAFVWMMSGLLASRLEFPCSATVVLTCFALALAWSGVRWERRELVWLMYALMALAGYRIVTRDLPSAKTMHLVLPLLLYGAALILLPRMLQRRAAMNAH